MASATVAAGDRRTRTREVAHARKRRASAPAGASGAAIGPNAYLSALLAFGVEQVLNAGNPITKEWLAATFKQPFAAIANHDHSESRQVLQTRICVEVLRQVLGDASAPPSYLLAAYQGILVAIGTSFDQIRAARTASEAERRRIADRIGIDLGPSRPDALDALFLEPSQITEPHLAALFGLADTTADPLAPEPPCKLAGWQSAHLATRWFDERYQATPARPLIDPDLIGVEWIAHPDPGNPVLILWTQRRDAIAAEMTALASLRKSAPTPVQGFEAMVKSSLGVEVTVLKGIAADRQEGYDVAARMAALWLTPASFDFLLHAYEVVKDQQQQLLDGEWKDVESILTQSWKQQRWPAWVQEEQAAAIVASGEFFRFPPQDPTVFPPPPSPALPSWRAELRQMLEWQSALKASLEQASQVAEALRSAALSVNGMNLPVLRDALLMKLPHAGSLEERSNWFTKNYQIDATQAGGQLTTRTGQAMQTLQGLLWAIRTEALHDTRPDLTLHSDDAFDAAWIWIGSYSTWVPAVLVTLYPENYFGPGLRSWSSPAYDAFCANTGQHAQLSPTQARLAVEPYADYFRDVNALSIQAACYAETSVGPAGDPTGTTRALYYMFAIGEITRKLYWCVHDPLSGSEYAFSPWAPVPGMDAPLAIAGAVPYKGGSKLGAICLFAVLQGGNGAKLCLSRFDLLSRTWTSAPAQLDPPEHATAFSATVQQTYEKRGSETMRPGIVVHTGGNRLFLCRLNAGGTGLDPSGWAQLQTTNFPSSRRICAFVWQTNGAEWWAVSEDAIGQLAVSGSGRAVKTYDAEFSGVLNYPGIAAFVLFRLTPLLGKVQYTPLAKPDQPVELKVTPVAASIGICCGTLPEANRIDVAFSGENGSYLAPIAYENPPLLTPGTPKRVAPKIPGPFLITDVLNETELQAHAAAVARAFAENADEDPSVLEYLREAYALVPIQAANRLAISGQYVTSLAWLRTVFDYTRAKADRSRWLISDELPFRAWARDPLHVGLLLATKADGLHRYVLITIAQVLLRYADTEFGRDSSESVPRARALYMQAQDVSGLLKSDAAPAHGASLDLRRDLLASLGKSSLPWLLPPLNEDTPLNPVIAALDQHIAVNLYKIQTSRNLAGMVRQLDPYALPSNVASGFPVIGGDGSLLVPAQGFAPPTGYRFGALIERAKQLAQMAGQLEATLLSTLERRDAEYYNALKARQDLGLAQAGVQLQDLRLQEAEDNVGLAVLNRERGSLQAGYYADQIADGLNSYERSSLGYMEASLGLQLGAAATNFMAVALPSSIGSGFPQVASVSVSPQGSAMAMASGLSSLAGAASTQATIQSTLASYERRESEWRFQKSLADQDVAIGGQQVTVAQDQVRIAAQERNIAAMQASNAATAVEYLTNKFTNAALYEWMSQVLEDIYRFFLQQATGVAQTAAKQLAFERQTQPPAVIQPDYWDVPGTRGGVGDTGSKGLTGSARLLQDVVRLEQYALDTNRNKLQLTRTVSLSRLSPAEFARFRETGVMQFATPTAMFDGDFPGHYLRLIRRVRVSVIALIPAADSIKATLVAAGQSRVVVQNDGMFRTLVINQSPQSIGLTSPRDATGLFELVPSQPDMLAPFEGMGVDATWQFELPRASNRFDFTSIADALLTIDYTALSDELYRTQVVRTMSPWLSADRAFSFRPELPDLWYELRNPGESKTPLSVSFDSRVVDFPPNLRDLAVQALTMYVVRADGESFEVSVRELTFTSDAQPPVGGGATTISGVINSRRGNGSAWLPIVGKQPMGTWRVAFEDTAQMRARFKEGLIKDVLFVVTYRARTPAWPGFPD
jgi:hypothetical protein